MIKNPGIGKKNGGSPEAGRRSRLFLTGMALMLLFALGCLAVSIRFRSNPDAAGACLYNAGIDMLGAFICAVLFFGSAGARLEIDAITRWFAALIAINSLAFLNNALSLLVQERAEYRVLYLILSGVTKLYDFGLTYFFYRYVRDALRFEGKFARYLDLAARVLVIPAALLILLNMFVPLCFHVDAAGVFHKQKLYWLVDLYLVFVAPPTTVLLFRSKAPRRQKIVAFSFILIPILHYVLTGGGHGYSTQYASTLVATLMLYCVIFNEQNAALSGTQAELDMAAGIQIHMLPNTFPAFPDRTEFDVFASMDPAREVGGDFYDFFMAGEDRLCLLIADVSGKGVPAALFMMTARTMLKGVSQSFATPAAALRYVNQQICENNPECMFVTVWLGFLEISTGKLTWSDAGHDPLMLYQDGAWRQLPKGGGVALGFLEPEFLDPDPYTDHELWLKPGDALFQYTDGVTEAMTAELEQFGSERLLAALNGSPSADPETLLPHVRAQLDAFVQGAPQFDDITMLALRYRGVAPEA